MGDLKDQKDGALPRGGGRSPARWRPIHFGLAADAPRDGGQGVFSARVRGSATDGGLTPGESSGGATAPLFRPPARRLRAARGLAIPSQKPRRPAREGTECPVLAPRCPGAATSSRRFGRRWVGSWRLSLGDLGADPPWLSRRSTERRRLSLGGMAADVRMGGGGVGWREDEKRSCADGGGGTIVVSGCDGRTPA